MCGGFGDFRIIEGLIAVTENQRAFVVRANDIVNELVIPRGGEGEKFAHHLDARAPRLEPKLAALFQRVPIFGEFDIKIGA